MKKYLLVVSFLVAVIFILPNISSAATTAELQAQIQALLAQISQLQAQMSQQQPQQWCYNFNVNLKIGDKGDDISALTSILVKEGLMYERSSNFSFIFDEQTASAVTGFQQKYADEILKPISLKYGTGFVGKSTRAKLNSLYSCGIIQPIPTNLPPTINGISGPTTLAINQTGTWEIKASDPENGILNYYVVWGDEERMPAAVGPYGWQNYQTTTFTHSYSKLGIYYPTFTVTDNQGLSAKTSISVKVGDVSTATSSLTIVSPNGGEIWQKGTTQTIKWQDELPVPACPTGAYCMPPAPKQYDIRLVPHDPPCPENKACIAMIRPIEMIAKNVYGYSYNWSVGQVSSYPYEIAKIVSDGQYTVQICQANSTICDSSDNYFKIVSATTTSLTVLSPNGGEKWEVGKTYAITWSSQNISWPYITINLLRKGVFERTLFTSIANDGNENWVIPSDLMLVNDYKINIFCTPISGDSPCSDAIDSSDASFSIVATSTTSSSINQMASVLQSAEKVLLEMFNYLSR